MGIELGVKLAQHGGAIDAQRTLQVLQGLLALLNRIEETEVGSSGGHGTASTTWRFTGLRLVGSLDATFAPSLQGHRSTSQALDQVLETTVEGFSRTECSVAVPPRWDHGVALAAADFAACLGSSMEDGVLLRLIHKGGQTTRQVLVTRRSAANLVAALSTVHTSIGSVTGRLKHMSSRSGFGRLLTDHSDHRVDIQFEPEQVELVRAAWNQRITVSGLLERDATGRPLRIKMRTLEVLPARAPSLAGLSGLRLRTHRQN